MNNGHFMHRFCVRQYRSLDRIRCKRMSSHRSSSFLHFTSPFFYILDHLTCTLFFQIWTKHCGKLTQKRPMIHFFDPSHLWSSGGSGSLFLLTASFKLLSGSRTQTHSPLMYRITFSPLMYRKTFSPLMYRIIFSPLMYRITFSPLMYIMNNI